MTFEGGFVQHLYDVDYTVYYRVKGPKPRATATFEGSINVVANGDAAKAVAKAKRIVLGQPGWYDKDTKRDWKPFRFHMTGVSQTCQVNEPTE
jgi:hypothetical protein